MADAGSENEGIAPAGSPAKRQHSPEKWRSSPERKGLRRQGSPLKGGRMVSGPLQALSVPNGNFKRGSE